jgi:hypothetical protein
MSDPVGSDMLSDVLRTIRLTGTLFFMMDVSAPWEAEVPDGAALASSTLPGAQHVISYHLITGGSCWGGLVDETPVRLEAGDVLVLPRGDAYFISTAPDMRRRADLSAEMAARLLSDGVAKVSAVGRDVGYDSEAAFSRAFKKVTGVPPARWRGVHATNRGADGRS